jgi:hypothetical protein
MSCTGPFTEAKKIVAERRASWMRRTSSTFSRAADAPLEQALSFFASARRGFLPLFGSVARTTGARGQVTHGELIPAGARWAMHAWAGVFDAPDATSEIMRGVRIHLDRRAQVHR